MLKLMTGIMGNSVYEYLKMQNFFQWKRQASGETAEEKTINFW